MPERLDVNPGSRGIFLARRHRTLQIPARINEGPTRRVDVAIVPWSLLFTTVDETGDSIVEHDASVPELGPIEVKEQAAGLELVFGKTRAFELRREIDLAVRLERQKGHVNDICRVEERRNFERQIIVCICSTRLEDGLA